MTFPPPLDARDTAALRTAETEARDGHVATGLKLIHDTLGAPTANPQKGAAYAQELEKAGLLKEFALENLQERRLKDHRHDIYKADTTNYAATTKDPFDKALYKTADDNFDSLNGNTSYLGLGSHYLTKATMAAQLGDFATEHDAQAITDALNQPDTKGKTLLSKLADSEGRMSGQSIDAALKDPSRFEGSELAVAKVIKNTYEKADPAYDAIAAAGGTINYAKAHPSNHYLTADSPNAILAAAMEKQPWLTAAAPSAQFKPLEAPTSAPFGTIGNLTPKLTYSPFAPIGPDNPLLPNAEGKLGHIDADAFAKQVGNPLAAISPTNPFGKIASVAALDPGQEPDPAAGSVVKWEGGPAALKGKAAPLAFTEPAAGLAGKPSGPLKAIETLAPARALDAPPDVKKEVEVKSGWGYWSVAATALGHPPYGTDHMTPAQLHQIAMLTEKIRRANHGRTIFAGQQLQIPDL